MESTGHKIRENRKLKGLTQKQLGVKAHMSVNSVQKYETGIRVPTIEALQKIADALEIPVNKLITISDKWETLGNKRLTQKPKDISEGEALLCIVKLLDYAGLDVTLSTDEIKRITKITKDLHKSLIEDIKENSNYTIIQ